MPRTNIDKVRSRLGRDYNGHGDLTQPIAIANNIVSHAVTRSAGDTYPMDSATALLCETELACHFYCVSDRVYNSRSTLSASGSFGGQLSKGLEYTPYGMSVKQIDITGWIEAIIEKQVVDVQWLGKTETEQLTFEERN